MAETAKLITRNYSIDTIQPKLKQHFNDKIVVEVSKTYGDVKMLQLAIEQYFIRNDSTAGATIVLVEHNGCCHCNIIVFAGGQGLLNFSWGANSKLLDNIKNVMIDIGFEEVDN